MDGEEEVGGGYYMKIVRCDVATYFTVAVLIIFSLTRPKQVHTSVTYCQHILAGIVSFNLLFFLYFD